MLHLIWLEIITFFDYVIVHVFVVVVVLVDETKYNSSVDLGMVDFTIDRVGQVLETLLDAFNVKVLAMEMALDEKMTADVVVESYAAWDRRRIAEMMGRAVNDGPVDPLSN